MSVCYLYNKAQKIEIILCENSTISYPLHNHVSVVTIGIVLSGSIVLSTKQGAKKYKENQSFAVYPYEPHSILAENNYTLLTLCIDKNVIKVPICAIKNNIVSVLMTAFYNKKIGRKYLVQIFNQLDTIISFLSLKDSNDSLLCTDSPFVTTLVRQLELCPECKLSVQDMAQNVFVSEYHFIRCFKTIVGLTPHQFQIQNRVRKAQRLLNDTKSLAEVALSAGFYDQSHFIKHFEKHVGLTPLSYKSAALILSDKMST